MVVGIIGILAAVAIPAYQKYQRTAEINVVKNTLSQIAKAFPVCLTSDSFGDCNTVTIAGTLSSQAGASIALGASSPTDKACFEVANENGLKGCIDFKDDGLGKAGKIKVGYPIGTPCKDIPYDGSTVTDCTNYGCTVDGTGTNARPCKDDKTSTTLADVKCTTGACG